MFSFAPWEIVVTIVIVGLMLFLRFIPHLKGYERKHEPWELAFRDQKHDHSSH